MMNNVIVVNTEDFIKNYLDKTEEKIFYNPITLKKIVDTIVYFYYRCPNRSITKVIIEYNIVIYLDDDKLVIRDVKVNCEYTFKYMIDKDTSSIQLILLKFENFNGDSFENNYDLRHNENEVFSINNNDNISLISMTYMINIKDTMVEERSLKEYKDVSPDNTGNIKTHSIPTKYFDHTQNEVRSDEDEYDENELDEIMKGIDKYLSKTPIMNPNVIPPIFIGSEKDFQKFKETVKKNCANLKSPLKPSATIKVKVIKIKK